MMNPTRVYVAVASVAVVLLVVPSYLILTQPEGDGSYVSGTGTIGHPVEVGCSLVIVGDDGVTYDPMSLDERFQVGMRVRFEAIICDDCVSYCMQGKIVSLIHIKKL